tara:strand:+ start:75 stop:665 length:591 start_codon:yes stop_codon:yes gene_type:complete
MRNLLNALLLVPILHLTSCSEKVLTQDDIVKANTEEYLMPKLNDPESYEFTKMELIDSVLYIDNIEWRVNYLQRQLGYDKEDLKRKESYKTGSLSMLYKQEDVDEINIEIAKTEKILNAIDSIKTGLGSTINDIASYTYIFSFRSNNALGGKVLNEYIIQTEPKPSLKIINMTDDKDKLYLTPNSFPGYKELIAKK